MPRKDVHRRKDTRPIESASKRPSAKRRKRDYVIDCDAMPFVPEGWTIAEPENQVPGRVTGTFIWDPRRVALHPDPDQRDWSIAVDELIKRLAGKRVLPAHVLDFLLAHPELIPEEWKEKYIPFWGTIYRDHDGDLCVRCLYWDDERWDWRDDWLDDDRWTSDEPAAVAVS